MHTYEETSGFLAKAHNSSLPVQCLETCGMLLTLPRATRVKNVT